MTDLFGAINARDEALERVKSNSGDWFDRAMLALRLIPGFEGTGEDIRIKLYSYGLQAPHHHNAWGALIRMAISHGRLKATGAMKHMRTKKSHARLSPVYMVKP